MSYWSDKPSPITTYPWVLILSKNRLIAMLYFFLFSVPMCHFPKRKLSTLEKLRFDLSFTNNQPTHSIITEHHTMLFSCASMKFKIVFKLQNTPCVLPFGPAIKQLFKFTPGEFSHLYNLPQLPTLAAAIRHEWRIFLALTNFLFSRNRLRSFHVIF